MELYSCKHKLDFQSVLFACSLFREKKKKRGSEHNWVEFLEPLLSELPWRRHHFVCAVIQKLRVR